jgi:RNA polymerase sigma factor (sigma-70 family)
MDIQQELLARCIKGDKKAEYELYRATYSLMMGICKRYIRQDEKAREVLNIAFFKVLTNLGKYRPEAPFIFWVRRIMINTLINEYKKEKVHYGNHTYVETYYDNESYSEINNALEKFDNDGIRHYINRLPAASRQVFNLYFIDGLKHAEIAELLRISEGTSRWHLNAAREMLKKMLHENHIKTTIFNE